MAAKKTSASTSNKTSRVKAKSAASRKTRDSRSKSCKAATDKATAGEQEVTIDRRRADRRNEEVADSASTSKLERRTKVQRRRQIDPTTCERDYSNEEVEFMNALDEYKRKSGRMFPTCSEVLEVIRGLGYVQVTPAELAKIRPGAVEDPSAESKSEEAPEEFEAM